MFRFVVAITLFCFITTFTDALNVQQCEGGSIDKLEEKVSISGCKKPPCRLRKKSDINVEMKFIPTADITKLTNNVHANILGIPFPFLGVDGTDACQNIYSPDGEKNVGCPLKANTEYLYRRIIKVLEIYPTLRLVVHWGLTSNDKDISCFEVPAKITN